MSEVKFRSGVDQSGFERDLGSMSGKLGKFNSAVVGMLSKMALPVSAGGIAAFGLKVAQAADQVQDLAERYGESATAIQKVGAVAKISGTDLDSVMNATKRLRVALVDAERGGKAQADALAAMGLSAKDLIGLPLPELLTKLAGGYQTAEQKGQGLWSLQQLMGRGASDLLQIMKMAPEDLGAAFDAAAAASDDSVKRMADLADAWENLKGKFMAGAIEIAGAIHHAFTTGPVAAVWGWLTGGKKGADEVWKRELATARAPRAQKPEGAKSPAEQQKTLTDSERERLRLVSDRLEAEREASEMALATDEERLAILQRQLEVAQRAQVVEGADARAAEQVLNAAIREVQIAREIEQTRRRIADARQNDADAGPKEAGAGKADRINALIDSGMTISQAQRAARDEDRQLRRRERYKDRYRRTAGDQGSLFDDRPADQAGYIRRGSLIETGHKTRPGDVTRPSGEAGAAGAAAGGGATIGAASPASGEVSGGGGVLSEMLKELQAMHQIMTQETG